MLVMNCVYISKISGIKLEIQLCVVSTAIIKCVTRQCSPGVVTQQISLEHYSSRRENHKAVFSPIS